MRNSTQSEGMLNYLPPMILKNLDLAKRLEIKEIKVLPPAEIEQQNLADMDQTLNTQLVVAVTLGSNSEQRVPLGYIPFPTAYGTIILNGIERAPVFRLGYKPGLVLFRKPSTRGVVVTNSKGVNVFIEYKFDEEKCRIYKSGIKVVEFKPKEETYSMLLNRIKHSGISLEFLAYEVQQLVGRFPLSQSSQLKQITAVIEFLMDENQFDEKFLKYSEEDILNMKVHLLKDRVLAPIKNSLDSIRQTQTQDIIESIKGIFPKDLKLRNDFKSLTNGKLYPPLNRLNPLSILSDCRKISRGPLGGNRGRILKGERDVHISHRNRICPIETPEGDDIGLTLFLSKDAEVNSKSGSISSGKSMLGYSASLIPFIGHNEGVRAIMGSKNIKQSVLLKQNEIPYIKTGTEKEIADFAIVLKDQVQDKFIKDGELALGTNLLVAYVPYRGYNFEDAIVVSDRLLKQDVLTSVHYYNYRVAVYADEEIEVLVKNGDLIDSNKVWCNKENSETKKIENFHITDKGSGIVTSVKKFSITGIEIDENEDFPYRDPKDCNRKIGIVKLVVEVQRKIQLGDKLTGRHGNKGVVGAIIPEIDMPRLPDGRAVDVILNPNGVISRMNLGQLLELHYSLLYKYRFETYDDGAWIFNEDEIRLIETAGEVFRKNDPENLSLLLKKLLDHLFRNEKNDCHSSGKVFLTDPVIGVTYDNPSVIGYQYIYKLNHLSAEKISVRGRGTAMEYDQITLQPTKGKRKNGGQRVGEMEFAALQAHNVPEIISEFLNTKSESQGIREQGKNPQATKAFFHYLHGMGLHAKTQRNDEEGTFTIEHLSDETLLNELKAKEISEDDYFEIVSVLRYSCNCGEKVLPLRSKIKQMRTDKLHVNYFEEDSKRDFECGLCKQKFKSSAISENQLELECECGKFLFSLTEEKSKKYLSHGGGCNSYLRLTKKSEFSYRFTDRGVFSEKTFGRKGTNARREVYGYIRLAEPVPHPLNEDKVLNYLPVIPPVYRPFRFNTFTLKSEGSYVNELYRQIIKLNNEEKVDVKTLSDKIRTLMLGDKSKKSLFLRGKTDYVLKRLQGKKGIIRNAILGRRMDFSARAVIIPAPEIHLDDCKLPYEILKTFFTVEIANSPDEKLAIKEILRKDRPIVVLNRAPSLHKYNMMAFYISEEFYTDPVIGINPLVCGGFGADHDGDVMAVHLVVSEKARADAMKMFPSNNIISDANSEPFLHFEQDIILGLDIAFEKGIIRETVSKIVGSDILEIITSDPIWEEYNTKKRINILLKEVFLHFGNAVCAALSVEMMKLGFELATNSGISISFFDLYHLDRKYRENPVAEPPVVDSESLDEYEQQCRRYLEGILKDNKNNPVARLVNSGARGKPEQVLQMVGLKGLVSTDRQVFDEKFFIRSNFVAGLDEEEYFYAAFKARDALMEKKLMAPFTGTILRNLTYALADVEITEHDCGSGLENRTPFMCNSLHGICQLCYGKKPLSQDYFPIGSNVGVVAAQSIGERSSQLSMKSTHMTKDKTIGDIKSMEKLIGVSLKDGESLADHLMEYFLPERTYIHKFKEIKSFAGIDDRHFSLLLRQLVQVNRQSRHLLQAPDTKVLNDLLSERKIDCLTLRKLINKQNFFSVFGYSQSEAILKKLITHNENTISKNNVEFFLGAQ